MLMIAALQTKLMLFKKRKARDVKLHPRFEQLSPDPLNTVILHFSNSPFPALDNTEFLPDLSTNQGLLHTGRSNTGMNQGPVKLGFHQFLGMRARNENYDRVQHHSISPGSSCSKGNCSSFRSRWIQPNILERS